MRGTGCKWKLAFKHVDQYHEVPEIVSEFFHDGTYKSTPAFNHEILSWRFIDDKTVKMDIYIIIYIYIRVTSIVYY